MIQVSLEAFMRSLTPEVHVVSRSQRFLGLELGARMTVFALSGGVLVHSPVDVDPAVVNGLGPLKWALAPNLFHHLYLGRWKDAGAACYAPPGLAAKRPDLDLDGVVEQVCDPFGPEVTLIPLQCFPMTQEIALLHHPSGTLVLTDLLFNLSEEMPWATRAAFTCLGGYPGCKTTLLERVGLKRDIARKELSELLALDWDRLIMAHGEVIDSGGKQALRGAFSWLLQ